MIPDITATSVAQQAQQTGQQGLNLSTDFNDFLTLLTTQLQNQDPLDPMDTSEFTNQIVQFSQVEQAINQNAKLDDLVALSLANIQSVALGYVGLDISYISAEANFDGESPITVTYALNEDALEANINITDETGQIVFSAPASKNVGSNEFIWDGTDGAGNLLPEGTYGINIDALNPEGNAIDTSTVVTGRVRGIEQQNGVIFLLIGDRAVPINTVINASLPKESPPPTEEPPAEEPPTETV